VLPQSVNKEDHVDILIGIITIVLGLIVTFLGLQVFFVALPIVGFFLGFFVGTAGMEAVFGTGFLSTITSWIVGAAVGLVFAIVSYLWWYFGLILAAGALGAGLGTGLIELFGGSADWLLFIAGLIGFALFVVIAFMIAAPVYIVIVSTALAGAMIAIAGVLLIFNQIDYQELGRGTAVAIVNASWWWWLAWLVLGVAGIGAQSARRAVVELPEDRWVPATSATSSTA
jgi:hypothetical protein